MNLNLPLPWQQQQWQHLQHLVNSNRLPHALLFQGINGLGIYPLANYFIQSLFCEAEIGKTPCNKCKACQLVSKKTHADFLEIDIQESSTLIKIDQIRELNNFLCQTAEKNNHRVVLINNADKMHRSAANALLKTLEEPVAAKALLILISNAPDNLLATIRSRCQNIHFAAPDQNTAKNWLADCMHEQFELDNSLCLANNAPLQILEWQQSGKLDAVKTFINDMHDLNLGANSAWVKKWAQEDISLTLDLLIIGYIAMLKKATTGQEKTKISSEKIFKKLDQIYDIKRISNNNINLNKQLLLEIIAS